MPHRLYMPLDVPYKLWLYNFMNFMLVLLRSKTGQDCVFIVVDRFSKMAYFIPCNKIDDATNIANVFFK